MCKRDQPQRKHTILSIVGLVISFIELIVASVYNAQEFGIGLSIIGIITSGLYLHFNLKYMRKGDIDEQLGGEIKSGRDDDSNEELNRTNSESKTKPQISRTTKVLMAAQIEEEQKKTSIWNHVLWVCYVILVVVLCLICFSRITCLFRRVSWRNSLDG